MVKKQSKVYVIDDDESVRKSLARLLRSANLDAEAFSSPEEFLLRARQEENACIIADIRMPGSTGFDLEQKLTFHGIRTPVIVLSASDDAQTREHARRLGAVAFYRKPVDDQALLDAVWWAISEARSSKKDSDQLSVNSDH
jgi:FixJ family two-component response regulator